MDKEKQDLLDKFAMSALTALITKMPLYDSKGEYGMAIGEDKLRIIKKSLALTAYEYASWMLFAREQINKQ